MERCLLRDPLKASASLGCAVVGFGVLNCIKTWWVLASTAKHSSCVRFARSSRAAFADSKLEATVTVCREPFGRTSMTSYTRYIGAGFLEGCSSTHTIAKNSALCNGLISCDIRETTDDSRWEVEKPRKR